MVENFTQPVWVLGTKIEGIKCFDWLYDKLDNFGDCGTLIVDMRSITESTIYLLKYDRVAEIQEQVKKRFISGGNIICVLDEVLIETTQENFQLDNEFWSPFHFSPRKIAPGKDFEGEKQFGFNKYLKKIKQWEIQIQECVLNGIPKLESEELKILTGNRLKTGDGGTIGGIFSVSSDRRSSGTFVAIPKIGDSDKEAIQEILKNLGIFEETPPPEWTNKLKLPGTGELETEIDTIENQIKKLQQEKKSEESKLENLNKFKKLLYATDKELEKIIIDALSFLGFSNVREGRSPEKEDVLFDLNLKEFDLAVLEVKGKGKSVDLDDFRQTDDWAWDYRKKGDKVKPILVANCFRLEDPSSTISQRLGFEPHRKYFEQHEIAVLPTWTLFKLVEHKLAGNSINIKQLEEIISSTNDVLKPDDLIR